jgi:hypothetical protein
VSLEAPHAKAASKQQSIASVVCSDRGFPECLLWRWWVQLLLLGAVDVYAVRVQHGDQ